MFPLYFFTPGLTKQSFTQVRTHKLTPPHFQPDTVCISQSNKFRQTKYIVQCALIDYAHVYSHHTHDIQIESYFIFCYGMSFSHVN